MVKTIQIPSGRRIGTGSLARMLILLCCLACRTHAANVTAAFDRLFIELGETVQFTVTADNAQRIDRIQFPELANLAGGQDLGISQQTEVINGAVSSHISRRYRLQPAAAGDFTVPSFKLVVDGQEITTPTVRCRVLPVEQHTNTVWLKIVTERDTYTLGETIPLELQLYSAYNIDSGSPPNLSLDGFIKGHDEKPSQSQTVIGGKNHIVLTFRMTATPTKGGDLQIGPASMDLAVVVPSQNRARGFDFFFGGGSAQKVTAEAPAKTLHILQPPMEGRPVDYAGAVGRFTAKATASRTNFTAGDAITVKIVVSGQGAFDTLPAPKLEEMPGITIYTGTNSFVPGDSLGMIGTKTYEQAVIVEDPAITELKFEPFSFFDPQTRRYEKVSLRPIKIKVNRPTVAGNAAGSTNGSNTLASEPTTAKGDGLRPLRVDYGDTVSLAAGLSDAPWFPALAAAPLLAYAILMYGLTLAKRQRLAPKTAPDPLLSRDSLLSKLAKAADSGDAPNYYNTLNQLLQVEIAPVAGVPPNSVNSAIVESKLIPMGLPSEEGNRLRKLFEGVDEARFGGIAKPDTLRAAMADVEPALNALRQLQWRN